MEPTEQKLSLGHVKKQGWATMPGEKEPESRVADECAELLLLTS
jgi:hypothetical protein